MTDHINIVIDGPPVPKGRPRFGRGRAYTPKKTRDYEDLIRAEARKAMGSQPPLDTPVDAAVGVFLPIPKTWSQKKRKLAIDGIVTPCTRPDVDNYLKAVFDGIDGIVVKDDAQIVSLEAFKEYSENPRIEIEVRPWELL